MCVFDRKLQLIERLMTILAHPEAEFRNSALRCLAEVAALPVTEEYDDYFVQLYLAFMATLNTSVFPPGIDIRAVGAGVPGVLSY